MLHQAYAIILEPNQNLNNSGLEKAIFYCM